MKKFLISLTILTSCGTISSLPSSSSSFLSSPIANSMFDKTLPEGLLLYEKTLSYEFFSIPASVFQGELLQANNFRRIEGYTPFYSVANATLSDFSNQQLSFFNEPLKVEDYQSSFSVQNTIQGNSVMSLIDRLVRIDDVYNQKVVTSIEKDLSFDVLGDSYFWFNNYIREESSTYTRYTNNIVRGITNIDIEYQTEVMVPVDAISQVFSDGALIIELYDETYPIGFFGATDYRTEVIRTQSNFKRALNLGPVHEIYAFNHALSSIQDELPIDNTQSIYSVEATGLSSGDGFDLKIELVIDRLEENTVETFLLEAAVMEGSWQSFTKMRQLVQLF